MEAINGELISLYRGQNIRVLGVASFELRADVFFLRVTRRRAHAGTDPVFAHGKQAIAQDVGINRELLRALADGGVAVDAEWQRATQEYVRFPLAGGVRWVRMSRRRRMSIKQTP